MMLNPVTPDHNVELRASAGRAITGALANIDDLLKDADFEAPRSGRDAYVAASVFGGAASSVTTGVRRLMHQELSPGDRQAVNHALAGVHLLAHVGGEWMQVASSDQAKSFRSSQVLIERGRGFLVAARDALLQQ